MAGLGKDRWVSLATIAWPVAESEGAMTQLFEPFDGSFLRSRPMPSTARRPRS